MREQAGLSLIELMIALAIGTVLVLGLVEVFAASRTSYQLSEGLSRVQENGRFAVDYLQRDLRMAGHFGCVNDQAHARNTPPGMDTLFGAAATTELQFGTSIQGYEASDTEPGKDVALATTPAIGGNAWEPALPAKIAAATANRVVGSDMIVLRYLAPEGVPVTLIGGTPTAPEFTFDKARWDVLRSGVDNPGMFGIADCMNATVFQASSDSDGPNGKIVVATGGKAPLNATAFSKVFTAGQAVLYRAESAVYYVGLNATTGLPSLYRVRFEAAPGGAVAGNPEELVEGIENMQLLYGQDSEIDPTKAPSGYINRQKVAGGSDSIQVTTGLTPEQSWRLVGAVRVGLVAVSPNPAAAFQADETADNGGRKLEAAGVEFTAPNDARYRTTYQTTIALRNRLYGN